MSTFVCMCFTAPYFVKKLPHEEVIAEGDSLEIECRVTEAPHEDVNANIDIKLEGICKEMLQTSYIHLT